MRPEKGLSSLRRLRTVGFRGSLRAVDEWATRQFRAERVNPVGVGKAPHSPKIARQLITARDHLCKADAIIVAKIEAEFPDHATARLLTDQFTDMVRTGREEMFEKLSEGDRGFPAHFFAHGLRFDQAAATAALHELWSAGQAQTQTSERISAVRF